MLEVGFARQAITPRVGVELCGFGAYINRHSIGVRDPLQARALAMRSGETELLLISCDLVGLPRSMTDAVRAEIAVALGLAEDAVMISCTHTHSGPATTDQLIGWGVPDTPYLETLPAKLRQVARAAHEALQPAVLKHAETPCEGMALNREYDEDAPPLEKVLDEAWRPEKAELTDTTCHVVRFDHADTGACLGHFTYFSCHPVVCCATTRYIHGDYCGVAMNLLEREQPGTVAIFLQGAQGDVNSCVVHKPEQEALLALDILAARFARAVRRGLATAEPLTETPLAALTSEVAFSRRPLVRADLMARLAESETIVHAADADDSSREVRIHTVYLVALRRLLARLDAGENLEPTTLLQAFRIGDLALLASPFEVMQAIKRDILAGATSKVPLVMGLTNDLSGYAPDRAVAARGGYAADMVPMMLGQLPFASIHDELVSATLDLEQKLLAL